MTTITAENMSTEVERIIKDCLFDDDEIPPAPETYRHLEVMGVVHKYAIHPDRVEKNRPEIEALLARLPMSFRPVAEGGGGGHSFLVACDDIDGVQWTGLHLVMEWLFVLGTAIDRVKLLLPRDLWSALPGGMPYYVVSLA